MKIMLVQPPLDPATSRLAALGLAEPLGLEYLAASLQDDHEVRILDLRLGGSLAQAVSSMDPEIVGVTALTASLQRGIDLLAEVKALSPGTTTVIGGHHPTLRPGDCLVDGVDVVVRGDGEDALREVASRLEEGRDLRGVAGVTCRNGDGWLENAARPLAPLDRFPRPARDLPGLDRSGYRRVGLGPILSALSSRGCNQRCSFCSIWRFQRGRFRQRSVESVLAELAEREEGTIDFVDDDAFADPDHMALLGARVAADLPPKTYRFFLRADTAVEHPDLMARWAEAGLRFALVGLESFRESDLRDMNKRATVRQNEEAIRLLQSLSIAVMGYLIVRPDYRAEDFDRLGDTVERLGIAMPTYGTLTPFPGTVLYEAMKDRLITRRWDHFDGLRAVVKTALPAEEYYHRLAELYRRAYAGTGSPPSPDKLPWYEHLARAIEDLATSEAPLEIRA